MLSGSLKPKVAGLPVEAQNFFASLDHFQRLEIKRPADVGMDVLQGRGFDDRFHIFSPIKILSSGYFTTKLPIGLSSQIQPKFS